MPRDGAIIFGDLIEKLRTISGLALILPAPGVRRPGVGSFSLTPRPLAGLTGQRPCQPSQRNDGLQSRRFLPRFYPGSGPASATMRSRPSHTFVGSGANNEIRRG